MRVLHRLELADRRRGDRTTARTSATTSSRRSCASRNVAARRRGLAGGQKSLQVRFGQRQLPQRHGQTVVIDLPAMALMKLHGDPCTGHAVAQLMGQAAAELSEQGQPFRAFDCAAQFVQLIAQHIDRADQVADLVVAARRRQRSKVALHQPAQLASQIENRPAQSPGDDHGQHDHDAQQHAAHHQRRISGLPARFAQEALRIKNMQQQRIRLRAARRGWRWPCERTLQPPARSDRPA